MNKENKLIKVQTSGTTTRSYHVTGSGEQHYASGRTMKDTAFSKTTFDGALRKASRKSSQSASRRKQT